MNDLGRRQVRWQRIALTFESKIMIPKTNQRLRTQLLTIPEVAVRLKVSVKTVRRLIERGELHASRLGRVIRIAEHDLARLLSR